MTKKECVMEFITTRYQETDTLPEVYEIVDHFDIDKSYAYKLLNQFSNDPIDTQIGEIDQIDTTDDINTLESTKSSFGETEGSLEVTSLVVYTLDQALEIGNVDLNVWEVDRYVQNSWMVTMKDPSGKPISRTNYQVKVWLRRKRSAIAEEAIKLLMDDFASIQHDFKINPIINKNEFAGEIALYDAHFGKFSWNDETGMGNRDTQICKNAYLEGCSKSLAHLIPYKPSKIFFIFGNDFMHFENIWGTTPIGKHVLDVDGRLPKVAKMAFQTVVEAINMCRSVAPVEVKWVPGNHDLHASFWLSMVLEAFYRNDDMVVIDNSAMTHKAVLWGNLLVGWLHDASGRKANAGVNILPQMFPELWGKSRYRELHVGHKHKKSQTKTLPIETIGGTVIRQIPSLSSIDFWHSDNIFIDAVPAGESMLWSKHDGVVGHYTINIKPVRD